MVKGISKLIILGGAVFLCFASNSLATGNERDLIKFEPALVEDRDPGSDDSTDGETDSALDKTFVSISLSEEEKEVLMRFGRDDAEGEDKEEGDDPEPGVEGPFDQTDFVDP